MVLLRVNGFIYNEVIGESKCSNATSYAPQWKCLKKTFLLIYLCWDVLFISGFVRNVADKADTEITWWCSAIFVLSLHTEDQQNKNLSDKFSPRQNPHIYPCLGLSQKSHIGK